MTKEDFIGLYEILNNILEDFPDTKKCNKEEYKVFNDIKNLKESIDKLPKN